MKHFTLSVFAIAIMASSQAQIIEPGFEGGAGGFWSEASTNFGTPICDVNCGGIEPYMGDFFAWYGGASAALGHDFPEDGWLYQNIQIPNGSVGELSFFCAVAFGGTSDDDFVDVWLDNVLLFQVTPADSTDLADWTQIIIDVSAWTDNQMHELQLVGSQVEDGGSSILFDDFSLVVDEVEYTNVFDPINREVELSIYPNPAADVLNLQFNHTEGSATVSVINMNGDIVSAQQMTSIYNKLFTLDTSVLESGMFQIIVELNGHSVSQRVVVAH